MSAAPKPIRLKAEVGELSEKGLDRRLKIFFILENMPCLLLDEWVLTAYAEAIAASINLLAEFTSEAVFLNMLRLWTPEQCKDFYAMLSRRPDFNPPATRDSLETAAPEPIGPRCASCGEWCAYCKAGKDGEFKEQEEKRNGK